MVNLALKIFVLLSVMGQISCASWEKRSGDEKRLIFIGAGSAGGAVFGAHREEQKEKNAALYGGILGVVSAVVGNLLVSDQKEIHRLEHETGVLKKKIQDFESSQTTEINTGQLLESPLPKELQSLVSPGQWKLYQLDQWVQDPNNRNVFFRQKEMLEIIPPQVR